jgi:two-component system, LuxR family, sensor kinase FixL
MEQVDHYQDQVDLLRAAFDHAPGFMALTRGPDHCFILANREYQRMTGTDPTGRTLAEALPAFVAQGIGDMLNQVRATGKPFSARNMPVNVLSNGQWREITVDFNSTLINRSSRGDDVLCLGLDVTERVASERQALELQTELTRVARTAAFGTMAATLAHELNQPLTAAAAFLSGARRLITSLPGVLESDAPDAIDLAEQEIQRAGEIVRQARAAVSGVLGTREAVPICAMIQDALRLLTAAKVLSGIEVQIDQSSANIEVWVNEIQIEQVLVNLVRNAAEAMANAKQKKLRISLTADSDKATCRLSDTGHGLRDDGDQFSSFTIRSGSMGLGLALSRTIVEAHGGRITIENNAAGGAVVQLTLPVARKRGRT